MTLADSIHAPKKSWLQPTTGSDCNKGIIDDYWKQLPGVLAINFFTSPFRNLTRSEPCDRALLRLDVEVSITFKNSPAVAQLVFSSLESLAHEKLEEWRCQGLHLKCRASSGSAQGRKSNLASPYTLNSIT